MNKNSHSLPERIKKVNDLLVKYFGIPFRPKKLPNPVDALIATILSQNTNDNNSYKAYLNLKRKYKSVDKLTEAPRHEIEKTIKVAGLGKQKSASIKSFLTTFKKKNGKLNLQFIRKMTDDEIIDELTSIKGIGVKTASCVLLFSLDRNVCPVDTHVHRTLNRIGLVKTNTPDKTFEYIQNQLPDGVAHQFHTNLIKLGREICKPAKPNCSICPLLQICVYKKKNLEKPQITKNNSFLLLDSI
jgi:endonuclease-3